LLLQLTVSRGLVIADNIKRKEKVIRRASSPSEKILLNVGADLDSAAEDRRRDWDGVVEAASMGVWAVGNSSDWAGRGSSFQGCEMLLC
jgi:hypothetical protein